MFEIFGPIFEQNANVNFEPIFEQNVNFSPIFEKKASLGPIFVKSVNFEHFCQWQMDSIKRTFFPPHSLKTFLAFTDQPILLLRFREGALKIQFRKRSKPFLESFVHEERTAFNIALVTLPF